MSEDELKEWILQELGAPMVKVELTKEQICNAIERAVRWFVAKKGVTCFYPLPLVLGQSQYTLANDVDTVLDVIPAVPPMDLSLIFSPYIMLDEKVPYDVFAAPQSAGIYGSFVQTMLYVDTVKRIIGADSDWRQEGRKLYIFPVPKNATAALVEYKSNRVCMQQLPERDHDLIKRYSLARAKWTLGMIRGKYDSMPTAQGTITMDGQRLIDDAKAEIEGLEEEISLSAYPMPFFGA
jgi:hypothetical protein